MVFYEIFGAEFRVLRQSLPRRPGGSIAPLDRGADSSAESVPKVFDRGFS
jgi:hypothetical protein